MTRRTLLAISGVALVVATTGVLRAQQPGTSSQEALLLARGWAYLTNGDANNAATVAGQLLTEFPLSSAGVALAVEAEFQRSGWLGALGTYEQWLGARRVEEPYALRRIARAYLHAALGDLNTRSKALEALIADGDQDAISQAQTGAAGSKIGDTQALAAAGDERAVSALIAQLDSMPAGKSRIADVLAQSRSRLAIPPLLKLLDDPDIQTRASAAGALGTLNAQEAVGRLRSVLSDEQQPFPVRFTAASALARLGDVSGTLFLRGVMDRLGSTPEETLARSMLRVQAAAALAALGPDAGWMDTARALLNDPDPMVRIQAARILAPYDNATSKGTLDSAMNDQNPAIREAAAQTLAQYVAGDFATLRRLLRSTDALARVSAAGRILELTR